MFNQFFARPMDQTAYHDYQVLHENGQIVCRQLSGILFAKLQKRELLKTNILK